MESHEPMKCHTESSIATLVPPAVGLSSYFFPDALSLLVHCSRSYSLGQLYMGSSRSYTGTT